MTTHKVPNRFAKEKSPYLLQYTYNPVNLFPWSEEAFETAKHERSLSCYLLGIRSYSMQTFH
ncbi:hypothetical protein GCM10010912_48740 [Paenibacillus albidus]|uniref:Spermatogenesis-associated protein 20-like TRX domain-containing protein n=1 Tax=Paenibacillus albidus TaxID=2041023 RepID=A0A917CUN0_9BACL|nr:hypothetical protein GCM10010912_48740 [Paenibacillus albidus]